MKKKILTLALVLMLCVSAAFMFAGCGDPGHMSTLTVDKTTLTFKVGEDWATQVNALKLNYKANGDTYSEYDKTVGDYVEKVYKNWPDKTLADTRAEASKDPETREVRTFTMTYIDVSTETPGTSTRSFTITVNNASVKVQYTVKAAQQPSNP